MKSTELKLENKFRDSRIPVFAAQDARMPRSIKITDEKLQKNYDLLCKKPSKGVVPMQPLLENQAFFDGPK